MDGAPVVVEVRGREDFFFLRRDEVVAAENVGVDEITICRWKADRMLPAALALVVPGVSHVKKCD